VTEAYSRAGEQVHIERHGDGPLVVRHADVVVTDDGEEHEVTRPVVAVCTCAKSQRLPWCDSTHKAVRDSTHQVVRDSTHTPVRRA
jgi:CDGSH-type Zn-finger protein